MTNPDLYTYVQILQNVLQKTGNVQAAVALEYMNADQYARFIQQVTGKGITEFINEWAEANGKEFYRQGLLFGMRDKPQSKATLVIDLEDTNFYSHALLLFAGIPDEPKKIEDLARYALATCGQTGDDVKVTWLTPTLLQLGSVEPGAYVEWTDKFLRTFTEFLNKGTPQRKTKNNTRAVEAVDAPLEFALLSVLD